MKYIVTFITFLLTINSSANPKQSEVNQFSNFVKIWGIIKYMHPSASRGDFDMNQEFIKQYEQVKNISDESTFEQNMLDWISCFDTKNIAYKTTLNKSNQDEVYVDYSWIESLNNKDLQTKLKTLIDNENIGDYYAKMIKIISYVELKDESVDFIFDKENKVHQFLFFASFWNTMQYWNVNITLNDKKWNDVLEETVSLFIQRKSPKSFDDIKDKLLARINDSHSDNLDISQVASRVKYLAPFNGKIVNDSLVITQLSDYQKSITNGIELGDVIFKINDQSLSDYIADSFNICSSNGNSIRARIQKFILLSSKNNSLTIRFLKKNDGHVHDKEIKLYKDFDYSQAKAMNYTKLMAIQEINEEIGYVNLESINGKSLKKAISDFKNKKGIIVDLRNYPSNLSKREIGRYLVPERKKFLKVLAPVSAGKRKINKDNIYQKLSESPFETGGSKYAYKGIIVLLVDRNTQSKAEWLGMAIQQNKKTYTLGEQTSGAILNANIYKLLNGEDFTFTNYMALDISDDYVLQRNGLKIDQKVNETARYFDPDVYLKEAIEYIESY